MDPNFTPTDTDSGADQPGTSPGGARPVEVPVEPQAPTTPEAHAHAEQDEEPAAPDAQQFRQTAANAGQHTWNLMLLTLAPAQRALIQNFTNATDALWRDLIANPARADHDSPVILDFFENTVALRRTILSLPDEALDTLEVYLDEVIMQIARFLANPNILNREGIDAMRHNVPPLLDTLINTNLAHLGSHAPQHDSTKCTVCLEDYAETDGIVVLPCHPTHHFHRTCIHVSASCLILSLPSVPDFVLHSPGLVASFGSWTPHLSKLQSPYFSPEPTRHSLSVSSWRPGLSNRIDDR
jgi:hypothetical protein